MTKPLLALLYLAFLYLAWVIVESYNKIMEIQL